MLLLDCSQIASAAGPEAQTVDTRSNTEGWHNGQRFQWVVKESEPRPHPTSGDGHWFLWAVLGAASFGVGLVAVLLREKQRSERAAAKRQLAESVMAEDPSMAEFLIALHETLPVSASATEALRSRSRNAASEPGKTSEAPPADAGPGDLVKAAKNLAALWKSFLDSSRVPGDDQHVKMLHELIETTDRIKEICDSRPTRLLASALRGLLKQLSTRASNVTPSALRTAAAAIDLLELLCKRTLKQDLLSEPPLRLLVVDDDPITRGTLSSALRKAFTEPELAQDGKTALILAAQKSYDLVLLDVEMPGLDGFEVCSKLHDTAKNCTTPVVFVTSHNDFASRAKSALAGANDLIGKPFLAFEITVKALSLVLRARLANLDEKSEQKVEKPSSGTTLAAGGTAAASTVPPPSASSEVPGEKATQFKTPPKRQLDSVPISGSATILTTSSAQPVGPAEPRGSQPSSAELARTLFESLPTRLQLLRQQLEGARDAAQGADRDKFVRELLIGIQTICAEAERAQLSAVLRLGSALEAVVKRLVKTPCYSTAAAALDTIEQLCELGKDLKLAGAPVRLLVVDDDPVARRVIGGSLQLAFGRPDSADCGEAALALAADKPYDLIFVDVLMPGMDGFATCEKLHESAVNRLTPVVFVTSLDDVDSRAKAAASGGCGFIPKPVLPCEIMLVALTYIVRGRLQRGSCEPWKDAIPRPADEAVPV